jgi:hypothetical protein
MEINSHEKEWRKVIKWKKTACKPAHAKGAIMRKFI